MWTRSQVSNLCDEYGLNPTVFYRWQKADVEIILHRAPFYPQSNGKQERWYATLKRECIRPGTPLSVEDARRLVSDFVAYYDDSRLHSAIGYIAPRDKPEGRADAILAERENELAAARQARKARRQEKALTGRKEDAILELAGVSGSRESLSGLGLLSNSR